MRERVSATDSAVDGEPGAGEPGIEVEGDAAGEEEAAAGVEPVAGPAE